MNEERVECLRLACTLGGSSAEIVHTAEAFWSFLQFSPGREGVCLEQPASTQRRCPAPICDPQDLAGFPIEVVSLGLK